MTKKAVSVTLDSDNILWLKGRARLGGGNLSETLDRIVTQARTTRIQPGRYPSVVGMVDLSDDPDLKKADAALREMFDESHARSLLQLREEPPQPKAARKRKSRG